MSSTMDAQQPPTGLSPDEIRTFTEPAALRQVVGYVRVSTKEQVERGLGLSIQRNTIERWCIDHGCELVEVYSDEGRSGTTELADRVGLPDALQALEEGRAGGLVVYKLDRLARELVVQESIFKDLHGRGYTIESCSDGENAYIADNDADPSRKMIRQILGAVGEYERGMIRMRMRSGRRAKMAGGGYGGGFTPYGWTNADGELVANHVEQAIMSHMVALRLSLDHCGRALTWQKVTDAVNEAGHRNRQGRKFQRASVQRIVDRYGDERANEELGVHLSGTAGRRPRGHGQDDGGSLGEYLSNDIEEVMT